MNILSKKIEMAAYVIKNTYGNNFAIIENVMINIKAFTTQLIIRLSRALTAHLFIYLSTTYIQRPILMTGHKLRNPPRGSN